MGLPDLCAYIIPYLLPRGTLGWTVINSRRPLPPLLPLPPCLFCLLLSTHAACCMQPYDYLPTPSARYGSAAAVLIGVFCLLLTAAAVCSGIYSSCCSIVNGCLTRCSHAITQADYVCILSWYDTVPTISGVL